MACPARRSLCGSDLRPFWPTIAIWRCPGCGLLSRNPMPCAEELYRLYTESWLDPQRNTKETGGTTLDLADICAATLARALGVKDLSGLRVLDFGGGSGAMVEAVSKLGADAYAVEPFGYQYLRQRGIRAFRSIGELSNGPSFDGIIATDVIEHLPTPWQELAELRDLLADSGWAYITTPNSKGLRARLHRSRWREALKPGHITLFTPRSLEAVLRQCGFRRYQRLDAFVAYSEKPMRRCLHYVLQWARLDGELRYLAFK